VNKTEMSDAELRQLAISLGSRIDGHNKGSYGLLPSEDIWRLCQETLRRLPKPHQLNEFADMIIQKLNSIGRDYGDDFGLPIYSSDQMKLMRGTVVGVLIDVLRYHGVK
jgi:hypothetical protein